jgi:hypothetical protein
MHDPVENHISAADEYAAAPLVSAEQDVAEIAVLPPSPPRSPSPPTTPYPVAPELMATTNPDVTIEGSLSLTEQAFSENLLLERDLPPPYSQLDFGSLQSKEPLPEAGTTVAAGPPATGDSKEPASSSHQEAQEAPPSVSNSPEIASETRVRNHRSFDSPVPAVPTPRTTSTSAVGMLRALDPSPTRNPLLSENFWHSPISEAPTRQAQRNPATEVPERRRFWGSLTRFIDRDQTLTRERSKVQDKERADEMFRKIGTIRYCFAISIGD